VVSSNDVVCYTNLAASPALALTLTGFSNALAVAVNPADANLILVADGGGSQQVKAFDSTGTPLWTYGLAGGYQANGVAVTTNKFWFDDAGHEGAFVCFATDGSFWVGDGGNHRSLHFSAAREYVEQIMFQPHSWMACVDQNNPSRVFNQFLEFSVDYTKPLQQGWTLENNWKANVPACNISWNEGLREVTTFTNGRTYALVDDNCRQDVAVQEVCELGTNGLRLTRLYPFENGGWISFGPDGLVRVTTIGAARWYGSTLNGFDGSGNPVWNPSTLIASAPEGATDPVPRGFSIGNVRATISTNNILISFDQSLNNGWHLGGIKAGTVAVCYGDIANPVWSAYFQFYTYGGKLGARVVQNTDVNYIGRYTAASLTAGWHFVAFTWSGENTSEAIRIYLDDTRIDDEANEGGIFTGPYSGSDVPLSVGAQLSFQYGIGAAFYGSQKQVRLYDRALADTEIGILYTNGLNVAGVSSLGLHGIQLSGSNLLLEV
jgi:hypothetical protein